MVAAVFSVGMVSGAVRGQSGDCSPLEPIGSFQWDDGDEFPDSDPVFISIQDSLLYSTEANSSETVLNVHDVSNPVSPVLVASVPNPLWRSGGEIILLDDIGVLQVSQANAFQTIDLSDPRAPVFIGLYSDGVQPGGARLSAHGKMVAMGLSPRIELVDINDPVTPTLIGVYEFPDEPGAASLGEIAFDGRYVYGTGSYGFGLRVIDFGEPGAPELVGGLQLKTHANEWRTPRLVGTMLFAIVRYNDEDEPHELLAIDVSDHGSPELVGRLDLSSRACFTMKIEGSRIHIGCGVRVDVVDISDPRTMEIIGSQDVNGSFQMVIEDSVLYISQIFGGEIEIFSLVSCPECEGDVNGDGAVDVNDISYVLLRLEDSGGNSDANGDGAVDVNDISYVLFRLGDPC